MVMYMCHSSSHNNYAIVFDIFNLTLYLFYFPFSCMNYESYFKMFYYDIKFFNHILTTILDTFFELVHND